MDVFISARTSLVQGFASLTWQSAIMVLLGCVLFYMGVARKFEPLLLVPFGFGVVLGNLPLAGLSAQDEGGIMNLLYTSGILTELFPCLLFLGLGAMIDFGPAAANPCVLIFGAAGQFGIFLSLLLAVQLGFARQEAVSIAIIGACDGPTATYVTSKYGHELSPAETLRGLSGLLACCSQVKDPCHPFKTNHGNIYVPGLWQALVRAFVLRCALLANHWSQGTKYICVVHLG